MAKRTTTVRIGARIQFVRRVLKLSQEELAARCDKDQQYISRLESGRASPSLTSLEIVCRELGVDLIFLFLDGDVAEDYKHLDETSA